MTISGASPQLRRRYRNTGPTRARTMATGSLIALVSLSGLVLAGCGDDTATATADGAVAVNGAWARTSPMMVTAGAAYMELTSPDGDRLLAASVDPAIAGTVELHETVPVGDGSMDEGSMDDDAMDGDAMDDDGMDAGGMDQAMVMRELSGGLELPAGETVGLVPGGYHIMLLDLAAPLEAGETFDLELTFENVGVQTVSVEVRDEAP